MNDLKEKNIVITGASGGIGNSIVKKFYENGANILATGTKKEKLEDLKSKFKNIKTLSFDISQHILVVIFLQFSKRWVVHNSTLVVLMQALKVKYFDLL